VTAPEPSDSYRKESTRHPQNRTTSEFRSWAVFRPTGWKAPTPPACHLARSGRNPDVRPLAGGLPMTEDLLEGFR
jgi:hypothetical protein